MENQINQSVVSEELLNKFTDTVLPEFVMDEESKEILIETVKRFGLVGANVMRAVGTLQRRKKIVPGLYRRMVELDQEVGGTGGSEYKPLKRALDETQGIQTRRVKGSDNLFVDVPLDESESDDRFVADAFKGVPYKDKAPDHCKISSFDEVSDTGFEIINKDLPINKTPEPLFMDLFGVNGVGSQMFTMLCDSEKGVHLSEMSKVVGEDKAKSLIQKYAVTWRYTGWFLGINRQTGRYRLFWIDPTKLTLKV